MFKDQQPNWKSGEGVKSSVYRKQVQLTLRFKKICKFSHLIQNMHIHSYGEILFSCDICKIKFDNTLDLEQHGSNCTGPFIYRFFQ